MCGVLKVSRLTLQYPGLSVINPVDTPPRNKYPKTVCVLLTVSPAYRGDCLGGCVSTFTWIEVNWPFCFQALNSCLLVGQNSPSWLLLLLAASVPHLWQAGGTAGCSPIAPAASFRQRARSPHSKRQSLPVVSRLVNVVFGKVHASFEHLIEQRMDLQWLKFWSKAQDTNYGGRME